MSDPDPEDFSAMNLYQKIHAVMGMVEYLEKDGEVRYGEGVQYRYVSEEKVTTEVRKAMLKVGLVIVPVSTTQRQIDRITYVDAKYKLVNVDQPDDYVSISSVGAGWDSQDKGPGKAMTYAYKYALLRTFMIPSGEDPDAVASNAITDQEVKRDLPYETVKRSAPPVDVAVVDDDIDLDEPVLTHLSKLCAEANLDSSLLKPVALEKGDETWVALRLTTRLETDEWRRYGDELESAGFYSTKVTAGYFWVLLDEPSPKQLEQEPPST